ncbi:glycoside hydrolase family 25 protein [Algoriphagus litoralis]|uniref:glycoside hydrolase family 25 protein n=1 Tax=Algoriphagus litoralis TaxID=2202829 RepID=UPI000DB96509|nr:glycoside hydrolase family 25 protein [Algoriphagus litoralis]
MPRKKKSGSWNWIVVLIFVVALGSGYFVFKFRKQIERTLGEYTQKSTPLTESLKFEQVFSNFSDGILGIDVSEYQGKIDFAGLQLQLQNRRIEFVVVRATMGKDGVDSRYKRNWEGFRTLPVKRGAYHYYRPNENSTLQAQNFIKTAKLDSGDMIPVLDIEKHSTIQSKDKLREGLKNWLRIVEEHYGVKPMIYTGDSFFWEVLHNHGFDEYPIWVANYNPILEPETQDWIIWQFSEKGSLPGIREKIDLNVLVGGEEELESLLIQ